MLPFATGHLEDLQAVEMPLQPGVFGWVRRHDLLALSGYDLLVDAQVVVPVWEALRKVGAVPAGMQAFETLRVEAGLPLLGKDMDENRLVMEVGRTAQAISYAKGCYLGQEPIVMARDRGHVNRSLLGLRILEGGVVPPGARVFHDDKEAGVVTSSVFSPRAGAAIALAYLQRGSQTPGTIVSIETPDGRRPAQVTPLPFNAPNDGKGS
jgi:folate-binding protein YgfZ